MKCKHMCNWLAGWQRHEMMRHMICGPRHLHVLLLHLDSIHLLFSMQCLETHQTEQINTHDETHEYAAWHCENHH